MAKPHAAAVLEDRWNGVKAAILRRRGYEPRFVCFPGYGSTEHIRVLARVVLARPRADDGSAESGAGIRSSRALGGRRGWRSFFTTPAMNAPVTVTVGARTVTARTDRSGLLDVVVAGHDLAAGWHDAHLRLASGSERVAPVLVVAPETTFGLVSDVDDTVIKTMLPRPLIAAWNTFVRHQGARSAVPGMATLYRDLLAAHPGAPVVYVSTGAWNTVPTLTAFLRDKGYPSGPLLMTDWGPTNTGWFRSGQDHKRACLHRLARELPGIAWVLIGDDGQHDPTIYAEFAEQRPEKVRAIAIRRLSATEQLLSHFTPLANDEFGPRARARASVPVCRASDGWGLARLLHVALDGSPVPRDVVVEN